MTDYFTLHHREIYFADLRDPAYRPTAEIDGYAERVIELVRAWLLGADSFTIRTSGSTGPAKGIELTRAQLVASAKRSVEALGLMAGDAALVCLNVETVGGLLGLIRAIEYDLPLTVIEPTADVLTATGPDARFATASLVPLQLQAVLHHGGAGQAWLNRMKAVLIGGAPLTGTQEEALQDIEAPIFHTYGMTETASHVALRRLNGPERDDAFTALPGIDLALSEVGALRIRADVTRHEWLQTTDRAELLDGRRFRWLGRLDDVINSGGVKVDARRVQQAVEVAAATLGLRHEALVVGLPDEKYGERVVAVLAGEPLPESTLAALHTQLAEALSRYELPKEIQIVPEWPRLASGKVDRQQLRRQLATN